MPMTTDRIDRARELIEDRMIATTTMDAAADAEAAAAGRELLELLDRADRDDND